MKVYTAEVPDNGVIGVVASEREAAALIEARSQDYFGNPIQWDEAWTAAGNTSRSKTGRYQESAYVQILVYITEFEIESASSNLNPDGIVLSVADRAIILTCDRCGYGRINTLVDYRLTLTQVMRWSMEHAATCAA